MMFWITAVIKDFAKLNGMKSCNPSQGFQKFTEKFYNSCFDKNH